MAALSAARNAKRPEFPPAVFYSVMPGLDPGISRHRHQTRGPVRECGHSSAGPAG